MSKSSNNTLGGVFCGRQIAPGLYAETVETNRYLIRSAVGTSHATRLGEVFGAATGFQAMTMAGQCVAREATLLAAAMALQGQPSSHGMHGSGL